MYDDTLDEALQSDDLVWQDPQPLLYTFGADWAYQGDSEIVDQLRKGADIVKHFESWKARKPDKTKHIAYFAASGVGTGKSRLLTEFPRLVKECPDVKKNKSLSRLLSNAAVFHVSFENGTQSLIDDGIRGGVYDEIGTRMWWQLRRTHHKSYAEFTGDGKNRKSIDNVLAAVSRIRGRDRRQVAAFIIIDGIQSLVDKTNNHHKLKQFLD